MPSASAVFLAQSKIFNTSAKEHLKGLSNHGFENSSISFVSFARR
jgi:hypothetical protein